MPGVIEIMARKTLKFDSFFNDIERDLERVAKDRRIKAAAHVKKKLRRKAKQKFGSGSDITKGVGHKHLKRVSLVGIGPPGHHAHFIEFGTDGRYTKDGKYKGFVKADPFVVPTYKEESDAVRRIMSEVWF